MGADWRGTMRRFRVNEPKVVFEAFDEEIVAVNLDNGNYYSMSGNGPQIWMDIADGFSSEEIVDRIQSRHFGDRDAITPEVMTFIDRLLAEELIVERSNVLARKDGSLEPAVNKTPFRPPILENYSDMRDLLMLDPIHDVDTAGWPAANTDR